MKRIVSVFCVVFLLFNLNLFAQKKSHTIVSIKGDQFFINGKPTYEKRYWKGYKIEGLLLNSRMVQGIFYDLNPETVNNWIYPDTKKWDADRNTNEFILNMEKWHSYGLLSFTINMQGGSPQGYSSAQPWHNSAYTEDGSLRPEYLARLERILDRADESGMVPILGLFYFGQVVVSYHCQMLSNLQILFLFTVMELPIPMILLQWLIKPEKLKGIH